MFANDEASAVTMIVWMLTAWESYSSNWTMNTAAGDTGSTWSTFQRR